MGLGMVLKDCHTAALEANATTAKSPQQVPGTRQCKCGAYLSRYNPGKQCASCDSKERVANICRYGHLGEK